MEWAVSVRELETWDAWDVKEASLMFAIWAEEDPIRRDFGNDADRVIAMVRTADKDRREAMLAKERAAKAAREAKEEANGAAD